MSKVNEAIDCFHSGFSCSQAVVSTYCEQLGLDKETALKVSCGFGGGMGRQGETCGAVSGAYMLIGLKHGKGSQDDNSAKELTYELVQRFSEQFKARNQFINCKELLGVDLITGDKSIIGQRVNTICPKMVQDAAEIIEDILDLK